MKQNGSTNPWSPEDDTKLRGLIKEGFSAGQMAPMFGRSRSSIIGRAFRLKLKNGAGRMGQAGEKKAKPIAPAKPVVVKLAPKPVVKSVQATPLMVPLLDLEHRHCRFPVSGDGADMLFCGHPIGDGPYCSHHAHLCFTPAMPRRRAA